MKPEIFSEEKNTLLYVEDNIVLVKFLQDYLLTDYNFYSAPNGREALRKLETIAPPDIIISDIMMDNMDGYEFLSELKKNVDFRDIPLIFLSAKAAPPDKVKGLRGNPVRCLRGSG